MMPQVEQHVCQDGMNENAVDVLKAYPLSGGYASISFAAEENKMQGSVFIIDLPEAMPMGFHQVPCGDLDRRSSVFLSDQEGVEEEGGSGHVSHRHPSLIRNCASVHALFPEHKHPAGEHRARGTGKHGGRITMVNVVKPIT